MFKIFKTVNKMYFKAFSWPAAKKERSRSSSIRSGQTCWTTWATLFPRWRKRSTLWRHRSTWRRSKAMLKRSWCKWTIWPKNCGSLPLMRFKKCKILYRKPWNSYFLNNFFCYLFGIWRCWNTFCILKLNICSIF